MVVVVVWVTIGFCFLSDFMTAAVKAAPVPALTAAMIAKVVFDIVTVPSVGKGCAGLEWLLYWHLEEVLRRVTMSGVNGVSLQKV